MQDDLFTYGMHRKNDPDTSKAAATSINATRLEGLVLNALYDFGPSTSEEVAEIIGMPLGSITPRFAPLRDRGKIRHHIVNGKQVKRPGVSGRGRIVWALND